MCCSHEGHWSFCALLILIFKEAMVVVLTPINAELLYLHISFKSVRSFGSNCKRNLLEPQPRKVKKPSEAFYGKGNYIQRRHSIGYGLSVEVLPPAAALLTYALLYAVYR